MRLQKPQANYTTIGLEAQAILYACDFYLRGLQNFEVLTDHRPLEGVLTRQMHSMDNARLLRMREKLVRYNFHVRWTPGKSNIIADAN